MSSRWHTPILLLAGLFAAGSGYWVKSALFDKKPPAEYVLVDDSGKERRLTDWKNQILMVNFWASWCPACVAEIPLFMMQKENLAKHGITLISVALEDPQTAKDYAKNMGINYPILYGEQTGIDLAISLGNTTGGLPYTVLLSPEGNVLQTWAGQMDAVDFSDPQKWLAPSD